MLAVHAAAELQSGGIGTFTTFRTDFGVRRNALPRRQTRVVAAASSSSPQSLAERAAALQAWVEPHCAPWPAQLRPVLMNDHGEHLMLAAASVEADQLVLRIPARLFMTAASAASSEACGALVKSADLGEWQALVLHLLAERALGPRSAWAPYVAVLGDQAHHPLLWDASARAQLVGSPMARTLKDRLQQVQEDADMLVTAGANDLPVAQDWQAATGAPLVSAASVAWAAAVLLGRSYSLDVTEPELPLLGDLSSYGSWAAHAAPVTALVPWADMLRHSPDAVDADMLTFDAEAGCALLAAHAAVGPGQEVCDSHGPGLSVADLLLDYGALCTTDSADHDDAARYDAVMGEHLSPRGSRNAALLAALEQLTGGPPALVLTARGPDVTCRAALRAGLASDAELVRAGWRSGAGAGDVGLCARVMGRLSTPTSLPTERRLLSVLAAAVAACMAAYPTTAEADAAELAAAAAALGPDEMSAPLEARVRVGVLRALLSEKAALAGAARAVTAWSEHLDELAASGASPSAEDLAAVYGDDEDDAV